MNDRCLECSICAIFFSSSLTDSTSARLRSMILSATDSSEFFILLLTFVTSCNPFMNMNSNSCFPIYPVSPHSFLFTFLMYDSEYKGARSSTLPGGEHEVQDLTAVIYYQAQFEDKEPSLRTFATFCQHPLKDL